MNIEDNLSSHISCRLIMLFDQNNVAFIVLPPHSTHVHQTPKVFRLLKKIWQQVLSDGNADHKEGEPSFVQNACLFTCWRKCLRKLNRESMDFKTHDSEVLGSTLQNEKMSWGNCVTASYEMNMITCSEICRKFSLYTWSLADVLLWRLNQHKVQEKDKCATSEKHYCWRSCRSWRWVLYIKEEHWDKGKNTSC